MALIRHWPLNDTAASTSITESVAGATTTSSRNASLMTVGTGNGPGGSLLSHGFNFVSSNPDYVRTASGVGNLTNGAVSLWAKVSDPSYVAGYFFDYRDTWNDGIEMSRQTGGVTRWAWDTNQVVDSTDLRDGEWHHFVGTYDGSSNLIYADGALQDSASSVEGAIFIASAICRIGERFAGGSPLDGQVADVRLYDDELFYADVQTLYELARPTFSIGAAITGTAEVGQTLEVTYTVDDTTNVTYQWYTATDASGTGRSPISGATAYQYTLQAAEETYYVNCTVTATSNASLAATSESAYTAQVTDPGGGGLDLKVAHQYYRMLRQ